MKHNRKHVCALLAIVLIFTFIWANNIRYVKASPGTITINVDGSVQQSSSQISNVGNVTYALTVDTSDSIVVKRDNIVLNGSGHKIQGAGWTFSKGVDLWYGKNNVTILNMKITSFYYGIYVELYGINDKISGCDITDNSWAGIYLDSSSNINVTGNTFTRNIAGITLSSSPNNHINGNTFSRDGLYVYESYGNEVTGNLVNGKPLVYLENVSNQNVTNAGQVILVNCSNIRVEALNLSYTTVGLALWGTNNSKAISNIIENCSDGIWLYGASENSLIGNTVANNSINGVYLGFASHNTLAGNNVTGSVEGIRLDSNSNDNIVTGNNVGDNTQYGISMYGSQYNSIYHNNFIDNTQQVYITSGYANIWDDGSPSGGNYWSNYTGIDGNQDGLGDSAYTIDANNQDNDPLMGPFKTFNVGTWNQKPCYVDIVSKSNVSAFNFTPSSHILSLVVQGQSGTVGFCRVTIPTYLMNCSTSSEWTVQVAGTLYGNQTITPEIDNTYIYFTYTHSTKTVQIQSTGGVPEDLQTTLLTILVIATVILLFVGKNRKAKSN